MREKSSHTVGSNRITAIFAVTDEAATLVGGLDGGSRDMHHFLSKNGNIIHAYSFYGTEANNRYTHYIVTDDLHFEVQETLTVIAIYDWAIEELRDAGRYDKWVEKYPFWAEAGLYYFRETDGVEETVEEQEFLQAFEEMTGHSFYGDNPMKQDWVNW